MSRRSLRPQLNQIRGWVRQGRTDAWIAHQLEVTVQQIQAFKREHGLEPDGDATPTAAPTRRSTCAPRTTPRSPPSSRRRPRAAPRRRPRPPRRPPKAAEDEAGARPRADEEAEARSPSRRARAPRRGRTRRRAAGTLEGTFDHGEEGYGLWLDPAVEDDPVYAEHWAGHRPVEITIEEDQIVIRRAGGDEDDDD